MKRLLVTAIALVGMAAIVAPVMAQAPEPPWPPGPTQVFIWGDTVTAPTSSFGFVPAVVGKQENFFPQTAGVLFRAYAVDLKTQKVLTAKDVKFFYVTIPGQPNVKMTYGKQGTGAKAPSLWTGTWSIPADYALGVVQFRILVKTNAKRFGGFAQAPVSASQLTVIPKT